MLENAPSVWFAWYPWCLDHHLYNWAGIEFTDNPQGSEIYRTNSITNQVLDILSDEDISRITKSGFIQPSLIRR